MELVAQLLVNSLVMGMRYGLVALGFGLVLAVTRMVHFAHGAVYTVAGYIFYMFWRQMGLPWPLALLFAAAVIALLAIAIYRGVYRKAARPGTHGVFVCSLGALIFFENLAQAIWGSATVKVSVGEKALSWTVAGAVVTWIDLATVLTGLALLGFMVWFLRTTTPGRAMLAMADHEGMAAVVGIDVKSVGTLAFAISGLLVVPAAVLSGLAHGLVPFAGTTLVLAAIAAAVIGGIGSLPGAVLGGALIGILQNLAAGWLPTSWMNTITFLGMFLILVLRPRGFLGKKMPEMEV